MQTEIFNTPVYPVEYSVRDVSPTALAYNKAIHWLGQFLRDNPGEFGSLPEKKREEASYLVRKLKVSREKALDEGSVFSTVKLESSFMQVCLGLRRRSYPTVLDWN